MMENMGKLALSLFQVVEESPALGVRFMYWGFAVVGVLTIFFTILFVPETRGKTLEQVVAEMEGHVRPAAPATRADDGS